jgi:hypothetical protein
MVKKCEICKESLEENEIGKFNGTIVKMKVDDKNELRYVCSGCQKENGIEELRKQLGK